MPKADDKVILSREKQHNYYRAFQTAFQEFKQITGDSRFDIQDKEVISIIKKYDRIAKCLKQHMNHGDNDHIDSHKISSIFLVLILNNGNLIVKPEPPSYANKQTSAFYLIPEIYFAFILGVVIMEGMYNIGIKEKVNFEIDNRYGYEFAKMIFANRDNIILIAKNKDCDNTINRIFCLSHIFYFIEKMADKSPVVAA